jgi:acyl-CoA synthetase (AMP-forming)/AMP-acid ligase II
MNLATKFEEVVRSNPHKTALYWGDREYTYEELLNETSRVAGYLQHVVGVQPGDRVALWL